MNTITANDLKTKGVALIENSLTSEKELVVTVRGKEKFVIIDMEHYNYLRECELESALCQAKLEYKAGKYVIESVDNHIKRVSK